MVMASSCEWVFIQSFSSGFPQLKIRNVLIPIQFGPFICFEIFEKQMVNSKITLVFAVTGLFVGIIFQFVTNS